MARNVELRIKYGRPAARVGLEGVVVVVTSLFSGSCFCLIVALLRKEYFGFL